MKREDDQQLWDLLGRAPEPVVSPFFARNVLRTVRQRPRGLAAIGEWFNLSRLIPASTVAVAVVVAIFVTYSPTGPEKFAADESDPVAQIDPQDYEVVADLDELLASDESFLWDENSSL